MRRKFYTQSWLLILEVLSPVSQNTQIVLGSEFHLGEEVYV